MTEPDESDTVTLDDADLAELRRSASDLSDLPEAVVADVRRRHDRAYDRARQIAEGTIDPLSA